jgi:hypothetical protein
MGRGICCQTRDTLFWVCKLKAGGVQLLFWYSAESTREVVLAKHTGFDCSSYEKTEDPTHLILKSRGPVFLH